MSRTTTAARRIALLSSSSLGLAIVASAASLTVSLTPTTAAAQAVCAPAPSSGGGTNSVTYSGGVYASGIDCDANGDMTVAVTSNGVDIGSTGITLSGGADDVTFNSGIEIDGVGLTGALLDIATTTGDITVNAAALDADQSSASAMTHGLRAITAGGDIDITLTGTLDAESSAQADGQSGIEARSTAGNATVDITTNGSVSGRLRGIYAQASGSGSLTINANNNVSIATTVIGGTGSTTGVGQIAAIDAVAGTGLTAINVDGNITGTGASGIRANTSGNIVLDISTGRTVSGGFRTNTGGVGGGTPVDWVVELNTVAGRAITLDNAGTIQSVGTGSSIYVHKALQVSGGSLVINNTGLIAGQVDFSGVTGGVEFNIAGTTTNHGWRMNDVSMMSPGSDLLAISPDGLVITAGDDGLNRRPVESEIDFLGGSDSIVNQGYFQVGNRTTVTALLTVTNLESFSNSGVILLGKADNSLAARDESDKAPGDVLLMAGTAFNGSMGGRIVMDVVLDMSGGQPECAFPAPAADCVGLVGGSTDGETLLTISDATPTNRFPGYQNAPITLIDVNGGTSAAGHFVIDPNSDGYDTRYGGVLKAGHFIYALSYDEDTQRHGLYSVPDVELMEFTALGQAIQGVWQTSTAGLIDRQAEARTAGEDGGVWVRAGHERSERDLIQTFTTTANTAFDFDTSYEQETIGLTAGADYVGPGYMLGAALGYIDSRAEFDGTGAEVGFEGGTLGLYGGYVTGPFFVDAAGNGMLLIMDIDDPAVGLPSPLPVREKVRAVGAQGEAGWRTDVGGLFVEPLVTVSYVQSRFDKFTLAEAKLDFDEQTSLRAGAGVRAGGESGPIRFTLTGRYMNEFHGENSLVIDNDADNLTMVDDFSGGFGEISGDVRTIVADGLGMFVNAGVKFADDYQALSASLGANYRW